MYNELKNEILEDIKIIEVIKIVKKVHGNNHPELKDVYNLYNNLYDGFKNNDAKTIYETINELRKITNNYQIPNDACEAFQMVYLHLKKLDERYKNEKISI